MVLFPAITSVHFSFLRDANLQIICVANRMDVHYVPYELKSLWVSHVCVNEYHHSAWPCVSNHAYFQKPAEEEQEKKVLESRYNLRRRKDDGDAKPAEQTEDKEAEQKPAAATAPITTELEFGGRLGERRNREMWLLSLSQLVMCWIESVGWGRMVGLYHTGKLELINKLSGMNINYYLDLLANKIYYSSLVVGLVSNY